MKADRARAPVDPVTRIPVPFAPDDRLPRHPAVGRGSHRGDTPYAEHHAFSPDEVLTHRGLGGAALMAVRSQYVANDWYKEYERWYRPSFLPDADNPFDTFQAVIFASAGFIPNAALRLSSRGRPVTEPLLSDDRRHLLRYGFIRVGDYGPVKEYLLDYILQYSLPVGNGLRAEQEDLVMQFLDGDQSARTANGLQLLQYASGTATKRLREDFERSAQARQVSRRGAEDVGQYVCNMLAYSPDGRLNSDTFSNMFSQLAAMATNAGLAVAGTFMQETAVTAAG